MRCLGFIAAVLLGGCFYVEDINQRPSFAIQQVENPDGGFEIHRGDLGITFLAISNDPDGDHVLPRWRAHACADFDACDGAPFAEASTDSFAIDIPVNRVDVAMPVTNVRVVLEGEDVLGATAKPSQEQVIAVLDAPPDVRIFDQSAYDYVASTPVNVFFEYGDADDGPEGVQLEIRAEPPVGASVMLTEIQAPPPMTMGKGQIARQLVGSGEGVYTVIVVATSPGGQVKEREYLINIGRDLPPCLGQVAPATPPAGTVLPLTEPTLFQVLTVADALDRFPTVAGDPFLGATEFEWSLKPAGGTRQVLAGATSNGLAIDPAAFSPGDVIELRVEVFDRTQAPVVCSDELATCSVLANQCLQRRTWRVEVR